VGNDPSRGREAVRPAVKGEVGPGVGVALVRLGRKVRRIGEDPVEPSETVGKVGPHDCDSQAPAPGPGREASERDGISVGRDHGPTGEGRGDAELPVPASNLEEPTRSPLGRERTEQLGVLADRIHARPRAGNRETVGS
jgi:hypothetical protein